MPKGKIIQTRKICEATIKDISPSLNLRSYLEGKTDLTLPQLRRILRAHFECHATELYTELSNAAQHSSVSVQNFVVRLMDMKQKVIFASQESESQLQYDPVLVQKLFLCAISTGLISYSIKVLTLRARRGGSKTTPLGFSSVVFARGMILKRNFG